MGHGSQRLKVKVLSPDSTRSLSAPKWVVDRLVNFIEKEGANIKWGDQIWLVMDVDRWKENQLFEIAELCLRERWGFALSNPCFEVWLLLHIKDIQDSDSSSCQGFKKELSQVVKGGYSPDKFVTLVSDAISRCQSLEMDLNSPIPGTKTSRVYLVAEEMLKLF